jgi:hypothetical protein
MSKYCINCGFDLSTIKKEKQIGKDMKIENKRKPTQHEKEESDNEDEQARQKIEIARQKQRDYRARKKEEQERAQAEKNPTKISIKKEPVEKSEASAKRAEKQPEPQAPVYESVYNSIF